MNTNEAGGGTKDHGVIVKKPPARLSWAWLFPILAACAAGWLFWSQWKSEGPTIEVEFEDAPGLQAGKTPLVYRGVQAGEVTGLRLEPGLGRVLVTVRLKAFARELTRQGTEYWIDQPVVGLGNTSGLDALIQGNSIQARMGTGPEVSHFVGRSRAPLEPLESPSLVLKLRAKNIPFLDRASPLFYHGVQVGLVQSKELDQAGNPVLNVVVAQEFAGVVRSNTRFWPIAATSLHVGQGGVTLDVMGLKAILLGGVECDVFGQPGGPAADGNEFQLFPNKTVAEATGAPVRISFRNGAGILAGETEVRHLGVTVGLVESATLNLTTQTVDTVVRFKDGYENLHRAGTVFSLMGPQISLSGVSGLETLVTGPYINCDPGVAGELADNFQGRTLSDEGANTARSETDGVHVIVSAPKVPDLSEGAPVSYRGLMAGRVTGRGMGADGVPYLEVAIRKEFAPAVRANARFWPVPAVSVQAGPGLLNIDVAGLKTLVEGGLAFDVFGAPEAPAENGAKYLLCGSEDLAKATSPPIRITFDNGQGLFAGRTQVRYLGLPVGLVESVVPRNGKVEAVVRLNTGYDSLRRSGSVFSVVRLGVSMNGVTGLETVVSGIYIDCVPAQGGGLAEAFSGVSLQTALFDAKEEKGFEVVVTAEHTNIALDAPVSYRGLIVGKVGRKVLSADGTKVGLGVVVSAPYATLLRENTKFWEAGGVKVTLGFFDIKVQTGSLDALARGGLAFATPDNAGAQVRRGHEYELNKAPRPEWLRWSPSIPTPGQ